MAGENKKLNSVFLIKLLFFLVVAILLHFLFQCLVIVEPQSDRTDDLILTMFVTRFTDNLTKSQIRIIRAFYSLSNHLNLSYNLIKSFPHCCINCCNNIYLKQYIIEVFNCITFDIRKNVSINIQCM